MKDFDKYNSFIARSNIGVLLITIDLILSKVKQNNFRKAPMQIAGL